MFRRKHRQDAVVPAQALDPVLASGNAYLRQLLGDETVPERRIVDVDVPSGVGQVRIPHFRSPGQSQVVELAALPP
jgi:hypothetical protein